MSELVHFEYPPPRSWEQFEELCADLFETMWSDPGLARHGRAGQAQLGVDIVAARGSIYPVGLQCKKKGRWPPKKLSANEIDHEVKEAEKFTPPLKEFYILTTAPTDERLQRHVRTINDSRKMQNKFPVEVLFWPDLVRRVALYDRVARKHFSLGGTKIDFSPLLATWYTTDGRLELATRDWGVAVGQVSEDFYDWPTGHVVVRQRETDAMLNELQAMEKMPSSLQGRTEKIRLRRKLRGMKEKERRLQETIRMLYTNELLKFYMMDLDESGKDAQEILKAIIESDLCQCVGSAGYEKIRLFPPTPSLLTGPRSSMSLADSYIPVSLHGPAYAEILKGEQEFSKKYHGNAMVNLVSELPASVRRCFAIPAIIRRIERIMRDDQKTIAEMQMAGYLDLNMWKYEL